MQKMRSFYPAILLSAPPSSIHRQNVVPVKYTYGAGEERVGEGGGGEAKEATTTFFFLFRTRDNNSIKSPKGNNRYSTYSYVA